MLCLIVIYILRGLCLFFLGTIEGLPDLSNENSDVTRLSFCSEISDSFTNVTPLTLSELSTEDSSLMSSSDSAGSVSNDIAQWQALWADHYNFQYQLTYENYKAGIISIEGKGNIETKANLSGEEKVDDYLDEDILVSPSYRSSRRRNRYWGLIDKTIIIVMTIIILYCKCPLQSFF